MLSFGFILLLLLVLTVFQHTSAFVSFQSPLRRVHDVSLYAAEEGKGGFFGAIKGAFEELDAFVDDATARRLGNGAAYYGKRKSSFYGKNDKMKKRDRNVADSREDFMVQSGGNFKWMADDNGVMRPVTRLKNKSLEKPLDFWGRKE